MARQTQTRSRKNDSGKKNPPPGIPFNLKRELEEITRNSGKEIDLSLPIEELEVICNRANNPPDSWRTRWSGIKVKTG